MIKNIPRKNLPIHPNPWKETRKPWLELWIHINSYKAYLHLQSRHHMPSDPQLDSPQASSETIVPGRQLQHTPTESHSIHAWETCQHVCQIEGERERADESIDRAYDEHMMSIWWACSCSLPTRSISVISSIYIHPDLHQNHSKSLSSLGSVLRIMEHSLNLRICHCMLHLQGGENPKNLKCSKYFQMHNLLKNEIRRPMKAMKASSTSFDCVSMIFERTFKQVVLFLQIKEKA